MVAPGTSTTAIVFQFWNVCKAYIVVVDRRRCGCHVQCHSNAVRYILLHVVQGWVTWRLTFKAQEIVTCVESSLDYKFIFNDWTQV